MYCDLVSRRHEDNPLLGERDPVPSTRLSGHPDTSCKKILTADAEEGHPIKPPVCLYQAVGKLSPMRVPRWQQLLRRA